MVRFNPLVTQKKVKFPNEFDALDIATDELREKMRPRLRFPLHKQ